MASTWMAWAVLAMSLWIVELLNPMNFYFACVGVGAAATALASFAVADKGWLWGIFFASSAVALAVTRPLARRFQRHPSRPANVDAMVGKRVKVVEAIAPDSSAGAVFVEGERWRAESDRTIPEGAFVEIVKVEGAHLLVRPTGE